MRLHLPLFLFLSNGLDRQLPATTPVADGRFLPLLGLLSVTIFIGYLTIGIPLPVLSLYVRHELGLSDLLAGLAVGISFLATVLTRGYAGAVADRQGPQIALRAGLVYAALGGLLYLLVALQPLQPITAYLILVIGRLAVGVGESLMITGVLAWGVSLAGPQRSGKVMAWVGMAMYGSLAAGAPIGLALADFGGFTGVAVAAIAVPLLALLLSALTPPVVATARASAPSMGAVVRDIWPLGTALALQGVGFAAIGAFATLHFTAQGWAHAGLALSAFGAAFVLARVLCGNWPDRFGGLPIAAGFFVIEVLGQAIMALADTPALAFAGAALTGFGCSMIFPALGREVVRRVHASSRGTALGAYGAFQDVAYCVTGPLAGAFAGALGYRSTFAFGWLMATIGLVLTTGLLLRQRRRSADGATH